MPLPTMNATGEHSDAASATPGHRGEVVPANMQDRLASLLRFDSDDLPQAFELNGMLASVGLESEDPAVAISVLLLVFILAIGACRAACRLLRCPAATASGRRGLHQAVNTAEDSDDSNAAPTRRRRRRPERAQRPKVVKSIRNGRDTEADNEGRVPLSAKHDQESNLAAAHALADSLLASDLYQEPEVDVEEATDSEAGSEAMHGEVGAEVMDSEAIADHALMHAQAISELNRADEQGAAKETRAMETRIARLELALKGKQPASNALPGCDEGRFDFTVAIHDAGSSNDGGDGDDAMTMVPIATMSQGQPGTDDLRQARLESVLLRKKEAQARKDQVVAEEAKQVARRALRMELLFIDNELDTMTNASTSGGPTSHVIASKWLLEYAYTKYPPRPFSTQRAKEELRVVRELRFRDAVLKGLKLMQSRYSPEKNTVAQFGAEWAVMAEEVAKHAFALQAGINRSVTGQQGFASRGMFPNLPHADQEGDIEAGEVEDAD